jgi:flagellar basal-body rod protein FlgB
MEIATHLSDEIVRYLDLSSAEVKLTAANMANIDTPGYKAVGMNFDAEMQRAMADTDAGASPEPVRVRKVDGLITRPDGNDVSMDHESLNLAEAQLRYKTGIALLKQEYQRVMDAIHADK